MTCTPSSSRAWIASRYSSSGGWNPASVTGSWYGSRAIWQLERGTVADVRGAKCAMGEVRLRHGDRHPNAGAALAGLAGELVATGVEAHGQGPRRPRAHVLDLAEHPAVAVVDVQLGG